ncbi:MAG TPA: undecaprenyldiphospho-muramoylpentapeptide beta-N-acetylglucosaminyltransferase [Candidatus Dormibacteraeota bacterium]|nr:undecaprenyldiphospho-muramoylpentapeptide beta-N-acetylglucosaminyltransferase [Candidatus Dormibacteraeota bacterium]
MRVLISGGGTGGHIFPALAAAQALSELDPAVQVLYVGRRGGMEERIVPEHGLKIEGLDIRGIQPEMWKNWRLPYQLPASVARAWRLIRRFDPAVVFGTGGYVVGAVGAAAVLARKPLFLMVPDAYPGRTIRALGPRARTVFSAFDTTAGWLPKTHVVLSGTPLRREFWAAPERRIERLNRLLVFGGSQGAHRLNTAVEESLKELMELPGLQIHHICGNADHTQLLAFRGALPREIQARYELEAFNDSMIEAYRAADLVVARAGGSVAELTAVGLPMVLVPGSFAGGHQRANAEPLVRAGAAIEVPDEELSGVRLAGEVRRLARDPSRLLAMGAASRTLGRPKAALAVAQALVEAAR